MRCTRLAAALALAFTLPASAALDVAGLDKASDPCTDFFAYANKLWLDATPIPDDRTAWGGAAMLDLRNEKLLEEAFGEALAKPLPPAGTAERKVLQFYASGMDTAAVEKAGLAPLAPIFTAIGKVDSPQGLARAMATMRANGLAAGVTFGVSVDARDASRYIAELGQGGLGLPDRDYYLLDDERSKSQREAYVKHVARMFVLAGDAPGVAATNAQRVMALETELARGSSTRVERRDPVKNYNKMTVAQLEKDAPGFPWRGFLAALGAQRASEINVEQPRFMQAFAKLAAERPADEWRTYLRWRALDGASSVLPERFEAEHFDFFDRTLRGAKTMTPRHRRVITAIGGRFGANGLGHAVGKIYVAKAFPPEAKQRAQVLIEDVKAALADRLRKVDWMGEDTRAASLEKLAAMQVKIGYPDKWRDFSDAQVGAYSFADNWMRSRAFDLRRDVKRIGRPVDRTDWWMGQYIVNAYYNPSGNEIVFPAAILQPPFFDATADDAYNYGGIGTVIGHEITHGFDDTGRQFDAKGNLREWWSAEDTKRYSERAQRAVKQYGEYEGPFGVKTNGSLTLGENLADVGGLKIAYDALQRALARKPTPAIDGLTPEQRFFIAFGQAWRGKSRPERERELLLTDTHSLPRYRVKGSLVQVPEFARAFSCDVKQALLPEDQRTNLW